MAAPSSPVVTVPLTRLFRMGWVPPRLSPLARTSAEVISRVSARHATRSPGLFTDTAVPALQHVRQVYAAPFRRQMGYTGKHTWWPPAGSTTLWLASRPPHWSALVVGAPPVAMPGVTARALTLCDADGQLVGLRPEAVDYLQNHYRFAERHQQRLDLLTEHLDQLFNFERLTHVRVGTALAADLRTLAAWADPSRQETLYEGLQSPTPAAWRTLRAVGTALRTAQRSFGRHTPQDAESHALLADYFAAAEAAYDYLTEFFEQPICDQPARDITPRDVVAYAYAALYAPPYATAYADALARQQWPALPLFDDFWAWVEVGHALYDLHLHGASAVGTVVPGATHYWLGRAPEAWHGAPDDKDPPEAHQQFARCQYIGLQTRRLVRRLLP